jgi:hypothetical protein
MSVVLEEVEEYKITKNKIEYKITANSKNINPKKLKKFKFYNKEKVIAKSSYYLNGKLSTKYLKVNFQKGYFLEGNFIMLDLEGNYKKILFKAKRAVFTKNKLNFKNVFITLNGKKYRKIKYSLSIND